MAALLPPWQAVMEARAPSPPPGSATPTEPPQPREQRRPGLCTTLSGCGHCPSVPESGPSSGEPEPTSAPPLLPERDGASPWMRLGRNQYPPRHRGQCQGRAAGAERGSALSTLPAQALPLSPCPGARRSGPGSSGPAPAPLRPCGRQRCALDGCTQRAPRPGRQLRARTCTAERDRHYKIGTRLLKK